MATSAEVFRLTRRNVHQLADMRTIVHQQSLRPSPVRTSLELPMLRRASPSSSASQLEWSRSRSSVRRSPLPTSQSHSALVTGRESRLTYRLTRTMSELPRSTHNYFPLSSTHYASSSSTSPSANSSGRHHSLVAMRTYYAYGARSMHQLDRNADHTPGVSLSTYGLMGTSSLSSAVHDAYTAAARRPYLSSKSSVSPATTRRVALSAYSSPVSASSYSSPGGASTYSSPVGASSYSSPAGAPTYSSLVSASSYSSPVAPSTYSSSSAYDRYYSAKAKSSGYSSSSYSPSSAIASGSSPSHRSYRTSAYDSTYSGSSAVPYQSVSSSRPHLKPQDSPRPTPSTVSYHETKMTPTRSALPQIVEHVSVSDGKGDINSSNTGSKRSEAEWQSLSDRNRALEKEVEQLKKQLREKERQETELKRRLFETAAEAKVWQSKYEQIQNQGPQIIHIREPGDESEISEELVGKLDSATGKLAKLDALREMALLQTEMEDALKEITERPV